MSCAKRFKRVVGLVAVTIGSVSLLNACNSKSDNSNSSFSHVRGNYGFPGGSNLSGGTPFSFDDDPIMFDRSSLNSEKDQCTDEFKKEYNSLSFFSASESFLFGEDKENLVLIQEQLLKFNLLKNKLDFLMGQDPCYLNSYLIVDPKTDGKLKYLNEKTSSKIEEYQFLASLAGAIETLKNSVGIKFLKDRYYSIADRDGVFDEDYFKKSGLHPTVENVRAALQIYSEGLNAITDADNEVDQFSPVWIYLEKSEKLLQHLTSVAGHLDFNTFYQSKKDRQNQEWARQEEERRQRQKEREEKFEQDRKKREREHQEWQRQFHERWENLQREWARQDQEAEQRDRERAEQERQQRERDQQKRTQEEQEKQRKEYERQDRERAEREKKEREQARQQREQAERERQRREKQEREQREQEQRERERRQREQQQQDQQQGFNGKDAKTKLCEALEPQLDPNTATDKEIRTAVKKMWLKIHPDKNGQTRESNDRFSAFNALFEDYDLWYKRQHP